MDWSAIKTEYITDANASYRKLAKKYGVGLESICRHSKAEHWQEQRQQHQNKVVTATISAAGVAKVDRAKRLMDLADKLVDKIEACVNDFNMADMLMDKQILRQITGAMKDIKDIQSIKSEAEMREQEARIAKLQKEARDDSESGVSAIEVTFRAGKEDWNE